MKLRLGVSSPKKWSLIVVVLTDAFSLHLGFNASATHYKPCGPMPTGMFASLLLLFKTLLQIDVSFSCVCPVIDHKFRHNIVKVAVDPQGDSRVDPQTTLTML